VRTIAREQPGVNLKSGTQFDVHKGNFRGQAELGSRIEAKVARQLMPGDYAFFATAFRNFDDLDRQSEHRERAFVLI
jgi:hypothetical protein